MLGGLEAIRALATRRLSAAAIHRAGDLHLRRAHAIWNRMPRKPIALRPAGSRPPRATAKDRDGVSLDDARCAAGFEGPLASVRLPPGYYSAFVEMHIEQGPLLEQHNVPLGVVTAIAAPASLKIIDRRRRRSRGRRADAGSARCVSRGRRDRPGSGGERAIQRLERHRGNRGRVRSFSRRRQQRPQPRADGNRCARHRRSPARFRVAKNRAGLRGSRAPPRRQGKLGTRQRRSSGALRSACRGRARSKLAKRTACRSSA